MNTFPMPYGPDFSSSVAPVVSVLKSGFGDGTTVVLKDGLNSVRDIWDLTWTNLTPTECTTAYTFLRTCAGATSFLWMAPNESTYRIWRCEVFKKEIVDPAAHTLTAKFEEAFI